MLRGVSSAAAVTFSASPGRTPPRPLRTRSTVAVPTPARRAIFWKVGLGVAASDVNEI
jgi:hypothetical protein